jgi:hypothetical protein
LDYRSDWNKAATCAHCPFNFLDFLGTLFASFHPFSLCKEVQMFDAYHQWLGISKNQRPPTFYQLLGVAPDETDGEVIKEAALRQTSHVRTYQTGPHAEECTRLLNEIARARAVLLSSTARNEYDAQVANAKEKQARADQGRSPSPSEVSRTGASAEPPSPPPEFAASDSGPGSTISRRRHLAGKEFLCWRCWFWVYAAILVLGGIASFWFARQVVHGEHRVADKSGEIMKPGKNNPGPGK